MSCPWNPTQLTTEDHGSEGNTWMAYTFHPGSWMCFASWRPMLGGNLLFLSPWQDQGLGTADILEGNAWEPLLCIHPCEHSVSCCWEGKRHSNEVRQLAVLQAKNHFRNKMNNIWKGQYERGTTSCSTYTASTKRVQAVTSVFQENPGFQDCYQTCLKN